MNLEGKMTISYEERLTEMRPDLAVILAKLYKENYLLIAELCDKHLDRSGNLLGKVRHEAAMLTK